MSLSEKLDALLVKCGIFEPQHRRGDLGETRLRKKIDQQGPIPEANERTVLDKIEPVTHHYVLPDETARRAWLIGKQRLRKKREDSASTYLDGGDDPISGGER